MFGRRIVLRHIIKLFYISKIYYEHKDSCFLFFSGYIPKPDMIFIKNKAFIIDYIPNTVYSCFNTFNKKYQPKISNINIKEINDSISKHFFDITQVNIINNNNYHEYVKGQINKANELQTNSITSTNNSGEINNNDIDYIINALENRLHIVNTDISNNIHENQAINHGDDDDDDDTDDDDDIHDFIFYSQSLIRDPLDDDDDDDDDNDDGDDDGH